MKHGPNYGGNLQAATELMNYIENDVDLYRQQKMPIIKNMARRIAKGTFSPIKAITLVGYLVESGAKKYAKEFGSEPWHKTFDVATRKLAASHLASNYTRMIRDGEYSEFLVKKNPSPRARANKKARRFVESYYKGRTPTRKNVERKLNMARHYFLAKKNPRRTVDPITRRSVRVKSGKMMAGGGVVRSGGEVVYTPDEIAYNRDLKMRIRNKPFRVNPRKKKRTFSRKQLAAQKRFGRMAKARANPGRKFSRRRLRAEIKKSTPAMTTAERKLFLKRVTRMKPGLRRNPVGFQCMLSTVRNGRKFWYTGKTLDTDKKAGVVMSEKTARVQAYKLAQKTGWPFVIESC